MEKRTLEYEIEHHYNRSKGTFTRGHKFVDSEGRVYYPLALVGEDEILIDVGGTDRQVLLKPHLEDKIKE